MTVTNKIKQALKAIMDEGDINACHIDKGWYYDGRQTRYGWHYVPFAHTPVFLGKNAQEALAMIEQFVAGRE